MSVYFKNSTRRRLSARGLERAAKTLLAEVGERGSSVGLSLVGDAAIRRMNREHRGTDRATDVLSFGLFGRGDRTPQGVERMLGDVVINLDAARRQAAGYDASLDAEVRRLLIHGVLHLIGHDHEEAGERALMQAEERRLAAAIGLAWPYP